MCIQNDSDFQKNEDLRDLNRSLGFVPLIPVLCFLIIGLSGVMTFRVIPVYGKNPDPTSLKIAWLSGVALLPFMASIFTIPASMLLTVHLMLNKVEFRKSDCLSLITMLVSVATFFLLKYGASEFFQWIMD